MAVPDIFTKYNTELFLNSHDHLKFSNLKPKNFRQKENSNQVIFEVIVKPTPIKNRWELLDIE